MYLRFITAGESHGKALVAVVEGIPAGLRFNIDFINRELSRRMKGYGRSRRMSIEEDKVEVISGLRKGRTIGSPIALLIENKDFRIEKLTPVYDIRPGHADFTGCVKFGTRDIRDIMERASARETASRVAVGAVAKLLLKEFGIEFLGHVIAIGRITSGTKSMSFSKMKHLSETSPVRCVDRSVSTLMCQEIKNAEIKGDTLGGVFEVIIKGVPCGLGSYTQWDRRLDANLAKAIVSIPGVKGVEIGGGFNLGFRFGSAVHDKVFYDNRKKRFYRKTNNAGGIEGGISNGEEIVLRAVMKPIATLKSSIDSVNIKSKRKVKSYVERADICVVPACCVIAEAVCAIELASCMLEKFGGDSMPEMIRNYRNYITQTKKI